MKKQKLQTITYLLLASSSLLTSQAFAEKEKKKEDNFDEGVYLGVGVGTYSMDSDNSLKVGPVDIKNSDDSFTHVNATIKNDLGETDFGGVAYVGYSFDIDEFEGLEKAYLGIEASALFSHAEAESSLNLDVSPPFTAGLDIVHTEVSVENAYAFSILPGYRPNDDVLLYLRGGLVWGKLETKMISALFTEEDTFDKLGGQIGAGFEYALDDNISMRGDYTYTFYSTVTQNAAPSISGDTLVSIPAKQDYSIITSAVNVGVTYRF